MLLVLKTIARGIALPFLLFLIWTPIASAWSWPVQGSVLQAFSYDETHTYDAGQHRGIDIGADAAGETVVAPAAGTIAFAGTVPTSGKSVTIATADGHSVTLTHLGSILVTKGATVAERDSVGTIGPSGTPELAGPYVHLGIRMTADPNGYVDPLGLLPPAVPSGGTDSGSTASQPGSSATTSTEPASEPPATAPATRPVATSHASTAAPRRSDAPVHASESAQERRVHAQAPRESAPRGAQASSPHTVSRPARSSRRPVVETAAPVEPAGLGAGHAPRPGIEAAEIARSLRQGSGMSLALALNGAAALIALGAALAAGRRRRRRVGESPAATAQVLRLPAPVAEHRRAA
jgi:hypothetical protein